MRFVPQHGFRRATLQNRVSSAIQADQHTLRDQHGEATLDRDKHRFGRGRAVPLSGQPRNQRRLAGQCRLFFQNLAVEPVTLLLTRFRAQ